MTLKIQERLGDVIVTLKGFGTITIGQVSGGLHLHVKAEPGKRLRNLPSVQADREQALEIEPGVYYLEDLHTTRIPVQSRVQFDARFLPEFRQKQRDFVAALVTGYFEAGGQGFYRLFDIYSRDTVIFPAARQDELTIIELGRPADE